MKFLKLALLPLMMLGMISCGTNENDSVSESSTSVQQDWSFATIGLMKDVLNNNTIPYFDSPAGGSWKGTELGNDGLHVKYAVVYEINEAKGQYITEMCETLKGFGYIDVTNNDRDQHPKFIFKLPNYAINNEVIVCEPQINRQQDLFGAVFYYQADQTKWNKNDVHAAILKTCNRDIYIPEPEFEFTKFELFMFTQASRKTVGIGLYTDDPSSVQSYYQTLEKNGYVGEEIDSKPGQYAYFDKDYQVNVTCVYDSKNKVCVIGVIGA